MFASRFLVSEDKTQSPRSTTNSNATYFSNPWWRRIETCPSPWKGKPQPVCMVCHKQIAHPSDVVPCGKNNTSARHKLCKPPVVATIVRTALEVSHSSRKGRKSWRTDRELTET